MRLLKSGGAKVGTTGAGVQAIGAARVQIWSCVCAWLLLSAEPSGAWDIHQTLMPYILDGASPALKVKLSRSFQVPCPAEDKAVIEKLVQALQLNPASTFPSTQTSSHPSCGRGTSITAYEILASGGVDDPDHGMDRDLPDSLGDQVDPRGDRKWMGGYKGPSSQGFRHMFFGGWKALNPLVTFQFPPRALGQNPQRARMMALTGKDYIESGVGAWGVRVLTWSLHYLQDLTQPFHAAQIVHYKMIPWNELFAWPPGKAFETFMKESTRTVSNYHWALEGYTRERVKAKESPYADCLHHPETYANLKLEEGKALLPDDLARSIADASIELAPELGKAEIGFFGEKLKSQDYNLSAFKGDMPYNDYAIRPDLNDARARLHAVTCRALANASLATRRLLDWAL